jgi:quinohemoprotein amine dehydrogenase
LILGIVFTIAAFPQAVGEQGIPVANALVIAKCANCHARDEHGMMQYVSWERTTPEGWQDVLKRMIVLNGVSLTPPEGRALVAYLSASHGLAPEEARPVMYDAERLIHDESSIPNGILDACAKCHSFARALSWRRSADDWKQFIGVHAGRFRISKTDEIIAYLAKAAPLHTPEWDAWIKQNAKPPNIGGRWLLTAQIPGRGKYFGQIEVTAAGDDDYNTRVVLTSVNDGSQLRRAGRSVVFDGYAWRGRSQGGGSNAGELKPDDPNNQTREALWIAPDQSTAEGRWFWGQYQEFGINVKWRRASANPTLLLLDRSSLKIGSQSNRIRLIGDRFPATATPADLTFGPGVTIKRVISNTATEVDAEVDVASDAAIGRRDVTVFGSPLPGAIAIFDRVDYVKVIPESSLAAFSDRTHPRGYQQFEAIGYQRGPDGRLHTPDDLDLGPLDATDLSWSIQVFHEDAEVNKNLVGDVSATGFFTPAAQNPNANFDVWVTATTKEEKNKNGQPLTGKGYLVVTVPSYTFRGHRYIRDLDHWIDDGPVTPDGH